MLIIENEKFTYSYEVKRAGKSGTDEALFRLTIKQTYPIIPKWLGSTVYEELYADEVNQMIEAYRTAK
jgi:hypothetical protein